tara:strand:+ start:1410 stop:1841 length:432 start_codon:yes stop_codon:yes gene_type:complete
MCKQERLDYNYDILCTYKYFEKEDEDLALICYQHQLMQILNIQCFDESIINKKISVIYENLKDLSSIEKIINILTNKTIGNDLLNKFENITSYEKKIIIFQLLFSYDYFNLFHNYISKHFKYYDIYRENIENSLKELYNLIDK